VAFLRNGKLQLSPSILFKQTLMMPTQEVKNMYSAKVLCGKIKPMSSGGLKLPASHFAYVSHIPYLFDC